MRFNDYQNYNSGVIYGCPGEKKGKPNASVKEQYLPGVHELKGQTDKQHTEILEVFETCRTNNSTY